LVAAACTIRQAAPVLNTNSFLELVGCGRSRVSKIGLGDNCCGWRGFDIMSGRGSRSQDFGTGNEADKLAGLIVGM